MSARTAGKEGTSYKFRSARAGERAQAGRALAALAQDPHLVPGTHVCIKIWWTMRAAEKPRTMALGFDPTACTGFVGAQPVWMLTLLDLDERGEDLGLLTGQGTLTAL